MSDFYMEPKDCGLYDMSKTIYNQVSALMDTEQLCYIPYNLPRNVERLLRLCVLIVAIQKNLGIWDPKIHQDADTLFKEHTGSIDKEITKKRDLVHSLIMDYYKDFNNRICPLGFDFETYIREQINVFLAKMI